MRCLMKIAQSVRKILKDSHKTVQFLQNLLTCKLKNSKIKDNGYLSVNSAAGNDLLRNICRNVIVILLFLKKNYSNVLVCPQFYSCITTEKIALTII